MAQHKHQRRQGYPTRSKYFQALHDEVTNEDIRELSEELCKHHRRYATKNGLSLHPEHATSGDTSLRSIMK